jgi:hypothetical protein
VRTGLFLTAAVLAIALAGCQSPPGGRAGSDSIPQLDANSAAAAGLSSQDLSNAAGLYTIKCAKCHQFYDPAKYSQQEWDSWMRKMSRKAKLKPPEQELLSRYLGAYRSAHP